jgi:hypothetical protein
MNSHHTFEQIDGLLAVLSKILSAETKVIT